MRKQNMEIQVSKVANQSYWYTRTQKLFSENTGEVSRKFLKALSPVGRRYFQFLPPRSYRTNVKWLVIFSMWRRGSGAGPTSNCVIILC